MESRKKRNLEIERRKKERHRIAVSIFMGLIGVLVIMLVYGVWDANNRRTIMTFEGQRVSTSDFRFLVELFGAHGEDMHDEIINELVSVLILINKSNEHGTGISEEEMQDVREFVQMIREGGEFNYISERRMTEIYTTLFIDDHMGLIDIYVPTYELDEDERAEIEEANEIGLAFHLLSVRDSMMRVKYLVYLDEEEAENALAELLDGGDFDAMFREQNFLDEDAEVETMDVRMLTNSVVQDEATANEIRGMNEGEISPIIVIPGEDGDPELFIIFQMYSIETDEEILADAEERFLDENSVQRVIDSRRAQAFWELVNEWTENANFTVNQRALSRF
jgi:hypothetical protein